MAKEKKNQGGRPPRYEGEQSVRIGALIRPRYKHALELVSRDRGMTLGEAIELAISRLSDQYFMSDGKMLSSYIKPEHENIERLLQSISFDTVIANAFFDNLTPQSAYSHIKESVANTPTSLQSSLEKYKLAILRNTAKESYIFDYHLLFDALEESWREGIEVGSITEDIKDVKKFYDDVLLPRFLDNNPALKKRISDKAPPIPDDQGHLFCEVFDLPCDDNELLDLFLKYKKEKSLS